jgi:hypothetical protein
VVSRIRPLLEKERECDIIVRADSADVGKPNTVVKIPNPKNEAEEFSFAFNGVYDRSTTQEELFTAEGAISRANVFCFILFSFTTSRSCSYRIVC